MNENDIDMTLVRKRLKLYTKVLVLFITAIVLSCFFIFIFNYDIAYKGGDIIPQSFTVVVYYFFLSIIAIIVAIIIKLLLKGEASLSFLLTFAIIIPILCYIINRQTLKEGGAFHFLVDEGGIFHFIAIKDFNFDGINDKQHYLATATRTEGFFYGTYTNKYLMSFSGDVTGVGKLNSVVGSIADSSNPKYDYDAKLSYQGNSLKIDKAVLEFRFYDNETAKNAVILLKGENPDTEPLPQKYTGSDTVVVTLDKAFFKKHTTTDYETKIYFVIDINN